jgi:hypothetical protein
MADTPNKIPLLTGGQLYEAVSEEAEYLTGLGFETVAPEDVPFYQASQTGIGVLEAGARGLFGPLATAAEVALGVEPEAIKKREKISVGEGLSTAIELGGLILPGMAITKAASLAQKGAQLPNYLSRLATASKYTLGGAAEIAGSAAAAGVEGQIARLTTKYGLENAIFGAADEVDKLLLSDEPQDALQIAENVASGAGLSFLIGAGLGAGAGKVSELWKARKGGKIAQVLNQAKKDADQVITEADILAQQGIVTPKVPPTAEDLGQAASQTIKSSDDLMKVVEGLPELESVPLETRKIVEEAQDRLRAQGLLKIEAHEGMLRALEDVELAKVLNVAKERGDDLAKAQITFEQHIKKQSVEGVADTITSLSPNPISDSVQAGQKFVDLVTDTYEKTKKGFESFFKQFDTVGTNKLDDVSALATSLDQSIPGVANTIEMLEDGILKLKPYDSTFPYLRQTHRAIGDVVKALNKKDLTIGQLRSVRKNLDNYLTMATPPEARGQISRLKKSLMDVIQDNVQKVDDSLQVRESFKAYRQNEEFREALESILGGRFGAEGVLEKQIKPENVLKRLFANTVAVQDAKALLGDKWNSVLADYLAMVEKSVIDRNTGVFSSANFKNFLKNKEAVLKVAFEGQEQKLQNLYDWNALMRIIPDRTPANPSRTAPTLLELGKQLLGIGDLLTPTGAAQKAADLAMNKLNQRAMKQGFDSLFKDKAAKPGLGMYRFLESAKEVSATAFEAMQDFIKQSAKGAYLVKNSVNSIFEEEKPSPVKVPSERSLQSLDKKLMEMEQDMEQILDAGGDVGYYMPEQNTAIGVINARVMNYLASQRPGVKQAGLLNVERQPTKPEMQKYYRTLQIAEQPAMVLKRIKEGSLISKDVQDIQAMYPESYNYFLNVLTEEIIDRKSENKPIPFRTRKSLSLFCGMPLDTTLTPQAIQAAQSTFAPKNLPPPQTPQFAPKSGRKSQVPSLTETEQQRRQRQD